MPLPALPKFWFGDKLHYRLHTYRIFRNSSTVPLLFQTPGRGVTLFAGALLFQLLYEQISAARNGKQTQYFAQIVEYIAYWVP
jgi:hypothetical protein